MESVSIATFLKPISNICFACIDNLSVYAPNYLVIAYPALEKKFDELCPGRKGPIPVAYKSTVVAALIRYLLMGKLAQFVDYRDTFALIKLSGEWNISEVNVICKAAITKIPAESKLLMTMAAVDSNIAEYKAMFIDSAVELLGLGPKRETFNKHWPCIRDWTLELTNEIMNRIVKIRGREWLAEKEPDCDPSSKLAKTD